MKFCSVCDNLLVLAKSKESDDLVYNCRSCKTQEQFEPDFNPCVYKKNYGGSEKVFYDMFINKYTKHDPTLPHVTSVQCQNVECANDTKAKGDKSDIVYLRYNEDKMKYIYLCCKCERAWIHPEYQKTVFVDQSASASASASASTTAN